MALWKPFRGNRTALDAVAKHDGYIYFCIDDGSLFFDYADADGVLHRKQINAKEAEGILGYSIIAALNESDVEIPTSKAVLTALADYVKAADLAPVATSGLIEDLSVGDNTELIFDGGTLGLNVEISDTGGTILNVVDPNEILTTEDNEAGGQTAIIN